MKMNWKKVLGSMIAAATIFTTMPQVDAANIKDYPTVAVMNFGNKAITSRGLRDHDFASATEYAIYQLAACGWFDLVDYEQLGAIANMHSINMSGLVDPATAVQMGKFAGAQFMVVGNVTGLTTKENVVGYQHGNAGGINNAQHVVTANVALRIVDIETGRIVVAGLGKGSSTSTNTEIVFRKYRNRKIETENRSDTISRDIKDEYSKNRNHESNRNYSREKNSSNSGSFNRNNTANNSEEISVSKDYVSDSSSDKNNVGNYEYIEIIKGDFDGDNQVTKEDIYILSQYLIDAIDYGESDVNISVENADLNGDGKIGTTDYKMLKEYLEGKGSLPKNIVKKVPINSSEENLNHTQTSNTVNNSSQKSSNVSYERNESRDYENIDNIVASYGRTDTVDESITRANNASSTTTVNKDIYYEREEADYKIVIGTVEVSDIQVRNAISKAVRDAVYGNTGIMTTLNNGKKLKLKTGF